jgi:hypothetical protein
MRHDPVSPSPLSSSARRPLRKRSTAALIAGLFGIGALAVAPSALASASGCTGNDGFPASCIEILGGGTYVTSMSGKVQLQIRQNVVGHFRLTGPGLSLSSPDRTYWNQSYFHHQTYGYKWSFNRNVARGRYCSSFIQRTLTGYRVKPPACKTVF